MKDDSIKNLIESLGKEINKMEVASDKEEALLRLQEIAKAYEGEDKVISSLDIAKDLKERPPQQGILTGFTGLDSILGGFTTKQLIVLAGITKHGKTSFAVELTIRQVEENPLWLPFEEAATELIQKFLDKGEEPPLFFTPQQLKENTMLWMEKKIVESKAKFGTKVVFIDHLGFIIPRSDNEALEIGRVMRSLKGLAKKWDVVIVVLAHLTKTQLDKHPNLEDLRGSAAIGQEADTVMFIWRETTKNYKTGEITISNRTNLSVQANRRTGKTGNIKLVFDDTRRRYFEEDWKHNDEVFEALGADESWHGEK